MRTLHYPISLPDSFDMQVIEDRVRAKSHAFEGLAGLVMKAFLTRSINDGAPVNVYAPFYVWDSNDSMREFVSGPLFQGVVDSFGRPAAMDWQVLEFGIANREIQPTVATMETIACPARMSPREVYDAESIEHGQTLALPGLFAAVAALDTNAWTIRRFRLWRGVADVRGVTDAADRFKVLALAGAAVQPDRIELSTAHVKR